MTAMAVAVTEGADHSATCRRAKATSDQLPVGESTKERKERSHARETGDRVETSCECRSKGSCLVCEHLWYAKITCGES